MNFLAVKNEGEFAAQLVNFLKNQYPGTDVLYMVKMIIRKDGTYQRKMTLDVPSEDIHIEGENLNEMAFKTSKIKRSNLNLRVAAH